MQTFTDRQEALTGLHVAMASAAILRHPPSPGSMAASDLAAWRSLREQLNAALHAIAAAPRPFAPDAAQPMHQALQLLEELRWLDDALA